MTNSAYTTIHWRWNGRCDMKSAFGWKSSPSCIPMSYVQTRWWLNMKNKLNKRENTCKHEVNHCNKKTDIIFMRAFSKVRVMKTELSLLEDELEQPRGCACASSWISGAQSLVIHHSQGVTAICLIGSLCTASSLLIDCADRGKETVSP